MRCIGTERDRTEGAFTNYCGSAAKVLYLITGADPEGIRINDEGGRHV